MEQLVVITNAKPSWGHAWTPIENDVFSTKRMLHLALEPWRLKIFNFKEQLKIWRSFLIRLLVKLMVMTTFLR